MWIFEPFQFAFMNSALLIALVVAIPCALLSVFLVLKGWALMGDAMSHAVFPGIVLAWMAGLPLAVGAFVARSVLCRCQRISAGQQSHQAGYGAGNRLFRHVRGGIDPLYCRETGGAS